MAKNKIEFKFWYILRDDNGFITEATVRFNEGNYKTVGKKSFDRIKQLKKDDDLALNKPIKHANGIEHFVFTNADFGNIKTTTELINYLVDVVKDFTDYDPIDEQKTKK